MPRSGSGIKDRFFRVYDGTPTTPFYANFIQLEQPTLPLIEPRPTSALQLDGGRMTENVISFIDNEQIPFEGIEVTFKIAHMSDTLELIDALGNPLRKGTWSIGGDTWVGVPIASMGTRFNSDNVAISAIPPKDVQQQSRMVNLVWRYNVPADSLAAQGLCCEAKGVVITKIEDVPEGQLMFFNVTAMIYGAINPNLADWPTGTESVPVA